VGGESADLFRNFESMHLRQVDIEQNQIRLQFFGLPKSRQPILSLDGLEPRPSLKRRAGEMAERRIVLDDENPQRHSGIQSRRRRRSACSADPGEEDLGAVPASIVATALSRVLAVSD
jgi:hypothetical protein